MKIKLIALSAIVLVLSFTNCQKVKDIVNEYTKFDIPYTSHVTLPNTAGINVPYDVTTPAIPSLLKKKLSDNGSDEDLVQSVILKSFTISLQEPIGEDFSFMKSLEVSIIADNITEKIAYLDVIPSDTLTVLNLNTTSTDVRELLKKDNFKLKVTIVNDEGLTANHKLEVISVFEVDAQLLD